MTKAEKIEAAVRRAASADPDLDPHYAGYFACFNSQRYFEAHDVLEQLWLETHDPFYKGLIQMAGAFVHLQKQFERPDHPKDRNRTQPAMRLFKLAAGNLAPYRPLHQRLNVEQVCTLCATIAEQIERTGHRNPWRPESAPILILEK